MAVSSINSTSNAAMTAADAAESTSRITPQTMGQDDFLALVVAQMSNQDPMNPTSDTEFIAQMAEFSALEQSKSMQSDIASLQANSLLGRTVSLETDEGELIRGPVAAVIFDEGVPQIMVNGEPYDLNTLQGIELGTTNS